MGHISQISGRKGGGKGGGGGGGRAAQEAPNTLRSKATARVIDLVSEGEIGGLLNGLRSVILDGTPVENADGSLNFAGVTLEERPGLPDQAPVSGFTDVEREVPVGVEVTAAAPVVRTITSPNLDALRIKMRLPALTRQNTGNGDLSATSVEFKIEVRPSGGTYAQTNLEWGWMPYTDQTAPLTKGLRVVVEGTVFGGSGANASTDLTVEYRKDGGAWQVWETRSATAGIPWGVEWRWEGDNYIPFNVWIRSSATASTTFEITDLPEGVYEVRATAGTIRSTEASSPVPIKIEGKTTSPYERAYRVPLPTGGAPWDIRITRLTEDAELVSLRNETHWSSYTELVDARLSYPDSAYFALSIDAEQFGEKIPVRGFEIKGIKVQVPSNYDPETRVYTGLWDGTFKLAWTDNPAWVLFDLLTSERYGLGRDVLPEVPDKWGLYQIAQYCDALVSNGYGGEEPRFTFNAQIRTAEDAYQVIMAIGSAFRGMVYWGSGAVMAVQDAPRDAGNLVAPANVIDGDFNYEGTGRKARHSAVVVKWNNPADAYKMALEVVEDPAMIARYGYNSTDVVAFGCTSRAQAHRFGRWMLYSEEAETEVVTYRASFDHAGVEPGEIIRVADPHHAGARFGGRVRSATTSLIQLDDTIELEPSESYTLSVVLPDGSLEDRAVTTAPGETDELALSPALSVAPQVAAMWALTSTSLSPQTFRVISNMEIEKGIFEIKALLHAPDKFDRVEQDLVLDPPETSYLPTGVLPAPKDGSVFEYSTREGPTPRALAAVSWSAPGDARARYYQVEMRRPSASGFELVDTIQALSLDASISEAGTYGFRVRAITALGEVGPWHSWEADLFGLYRTPVAPAEYRVSVLDGQAHQSWTVTTDALISHYKIRHSPDPAETEWSSMVDLVLDTGLVHATSVPAMGGVYAIKPVTFAGIESDDPALIVSPTVGLASLNVVETIVEDPAFAGAKTDLALTGAGLALTSGDDLFARSDFFGVSDFFLGVGGLKSSGIYEVSEVVDLGEVYTSRVTASMGVGVVNMAADFFGVPDLFDQADIFGISSTNIGVELQLATTADDPAGSPVWSAWQPFVIGDYDFRAIKFRAILTSSEFAISPVLEALTLAIDMPDRLLSGDDLVADAAGASIVFSPSFKAVPALAVTGQDMASGDRFEIINKTSAGFDLRFFNSGGSGVSRTFDYVANGYGRGA